MSEKLTPQQCQAVENRGGKLLVSAAAGSGKTKVLVDRLMRYILDPVNPANIDEFLIITYTKAAASELRGKIAAKLSEHMAQAPENRHLQQQMQRLYLAKISTVHGFCGDVLRQYAYRLNIASDFRVADEAECLELQIKALEQTLEEAYETADSNPDFCAFVDSQGLGRDDRQIPEILLKVYQSAKCHLNADSWLDWCASGNVDGVQDAAQTPWGAYLVFDLKRYLSLQIAALQRCVAAGSAVDGMEKPVALFEATITQLQRLYDSNSWNEIIDNSDIQYGTLTFSKKCTHLQLIGQMKAVRNACKEGLAKRLRSFVDRSDKVLADVSASAHATRGLVALVQAFEKHYTHLKGRRGIVDFSDLEHYTMDLLLGKQRNAVTSVAMEISACFREIMVDEYQDSNEIQDAIFSALTHKKQNCFMVGDVKQSIYQFRLADPSIFIRKYNTFAPVEKAQIGDGRKVLLNHNFRSSGGVIEAVNDVFSRCMSQEVGGLTYGEQEQLCEGIPHIPLNEPEVSLFGIEVENDTYAEEAAFTAEKISQLLDGTHFVRDGESLRKIMPEDIVILLRSPGSVSGEFQYALQQKGIPCVTSDQGSLLQTEEVSTVCAILEVIHNPVQDIPLTAVLMSPVFGFTAEELAVLRSGNRNADMYTLIADADDLKCRNFMLSLNAIRQTARLSTVTQVLSAVYAKTNLLSIYSSLPDGKKRLDNLHTFFQIASDYEASGPKDLSRFLEHVRACEERGFSSAADKQGSGVTIMSIHKSKGLEFPVVFLCGLSRAFNQESTRGQVLCDIDLGLGLSCVDTGLRVRYPNIIKRAIAVKIHRESISEELRVLYVAMTRARDRLIMTYADRKLADKLQEIAMRLDMSDGVLLSAEVTCPGDWVLQTALTRTEAGQFFALGGKPDCTAVREILWKIAACRCGDLHTVGALETAQQNGILTEELEILSAGIAFQYPYSSATQIPSKLTATQLKGRALDTEVADGSAIWPAEKFRRPGAHGKTSGIAFGTAMHAVLQHIDLSKCNTVKAICDEVERLVAERRISAEQAEIVNCQKLAVFFTSPVGKKLQGNAQILREFKFSYLDDAEKYYPNTAGEKILFQGVLDCAILEDDGVTIVDFKTDFVTEETLLSVSEKYKSQVLSYADAVSRIYQMPVKEALLYFFSLNRQVNVI